MNALPNWFVLFFLWFSSTIYISLLSADSAPGYPSIKIPQPGEVTGLPGQSQILSKQYSGQVKVSDCGNYIFFWFFESQASPDDPVVVWLNGGPGASSMIGLFRENGPLMLEESRGRGIEVKARPASWNSNANYLVIDQPAGTGFSFSANPDTCLPTNEAESTRQLYTALQKIFNVLPTHYKSNDLYIFGESFAGHYVPRLAQYIVNENVDENVDENGSGKGSSPPIHLNLKGIGIGDGWVDPESQLGGIADFVFYQGLVAEDGWRALKQAEKQCTDELAKYNSPAYMNGTLAIPAHVTDLFDRIKEIFADLTGKNTYNLDLVGNYHYSTMTNYLNLDNVRQALHLSSSTPPWTVENPKVSDTLKEGKMNSMIKFIGDILNSSDVRVLIYEGTRDGRSGPAGANKWLRKMQSQYWPEGKAFPGNFHKWMVDGNQQGLYRTYPDNSPLSKSQLAQVVVYNAGHFMPMDKPENALKMFNSFIGSIVTP